MNASFVPVFVADTVVAGMAAAPLVAYHSAASLDYLVAYYAYGSGVMDIFQSPYWYKNSPSRFLTGFLSDISKAKLTSLIFFP